MTPKFAKSSDGAVAIELVESGAFDAWLESQSAAGQNWAAVNGFSGKLGDVLVLPNADGQTSSVAVGWGSEQARGRDRFHLAGAAAKLPVGDYCLGGTHSVRDAEESALGWLLGMYRFDRYKTKPTAKANLVCPEGVNAAKIEAIAAGEYLTRDLINTPTSDLGPSDLQAAFLALAKQFGAKANVIEGEALLDQNFPMIHAVGRASDNAPRLLDMRWGDAKNRSVTLVGKGVCFDTGGLNIKPGASMGTMKKDMGGAATVMGLAHMIMALNLPVSLRVLVPAVENSISAGAFRPGDVLHSRKGLTVEINNTDAEGRLVLADALALADEESPDLLICMATLTGAARVAVGPDLVPFYSDDDDLAASVAQAGKDVCDPMWRMPFWEPYEAMIEPDIADLDNAPKGGHAGSITAALFLRRFVENAKQFAHFDIFGSAPVSKPGRPMGAVGQGARALLEVIANGNSK